MKQAVVRRGMAAAIVGVVLGAVAAQAGAAGWAIDVAGGQDHPLIQRFNDSWLMAYRQLEFDATDFPGAAGIDRNLKFNSPVSVEGRITRLVYFAPLGKTRLEVHRNYEQALVAAGMKPVISCTPSVATCEQLPIALGERYRGMKEADFSASRSRHREGSALHQQMRSLGGTNMLGNEDFYFTYGTLNRGGSPVHVLVSTAKVYSTEFTSTYIEIAEPKAMQTGQVTVNAAALGSGLKAEGKVALYGIYFDSGKAEVKAESKAQLQEIARLLTAQAKLRVLLVGHTDNQGGVDANLQLSQRRAQAVVDALVKSYRIDASRLGARGVGSLAPVASNEAEEGRSRNRRVELVLP